MQMRVGPPKGGLQDVMQLTQGDVAVDVDPSPDCGSMSRIGA
jgi:hypothetical protein